MFCLPKREMVLGQVMFTRKTTEVPGWFSQNPEKVAFWLKAAGEVQPKLRKSSFLAESSRGYSAKTQEELENRLTVFITDKRNQEKDLIPLISSFAD